MTNLVETVQGWWNSAKSAKAKTRAHFPIDRAHADNGASLGPPFVAKDHYFQVIVHEMFLATSRKWFVEYDPMVLAAASYIYDTKVETVPFVVGPALLKDFGQPVPNGMIFRNTPVSGLHPFQGGAFTLTLMLFQVQRQNNADKLLKVVEGISKSLDPSNTLTSYLKVAATVADGVEAILGLKETIPVLGYRVTINPQVNEPLTPDYWVLIDDDSNSKKMKPDRFRVRKSRLYHIDGDPEEEEEYRDHDFVLFRIAQGDKRNDERTLSFFPLWTAAQDFAARGDDEFWKEAKAQFNTLKRSLLTSPDLTRRDSERFRNDYLEDLKKLRKQSVDEGLLADAPPLPIEEKEMRRVVKELDALDNL